MKSSSRSPTDFVNKCSNWIVYMLRAKSLEGAEGLYFRTAEAAVSITAAKHAAVVMPFKSGMLKVVGCCGIPTAKLEEFPDTRGIIGKAFREGFRGDGKGYLIVNDVSEDKNYYSFDENVKSELVVPIFDSDRKNILTIINVESYRKGHFKPNHAELLFKLGEVMVENTELRLIMDKLQRRIECYYGILDNIPDELMVIDKNFQPVYANKIKRRRLLELDEYLQQHGESLLDQFCSCTRPSGRTIRNTCYSLIEDQRSICSGCVCNKVMKLGRPVQGVVYKPHVRGHPVVELSAAPLLDSKKCLVGCIEIARDVNQREAVLGLATNLFKGHDEGQLLERVTELLNENLRYDRVRLYALKYDNEKNQNFLRGITYSGIHRKLKEHDFSEVKIYVPNKLKPILAESEKASLIDLEGAEEPDDCLGYWQVGLARNEAHDFIDPQGWLELEDVSKLVSVPIYTSRDRWIAFLDSKYHKQKRFTSDDLQALTAFSRIASTALEWVHQNKVRFRFAVLGETTLGLRHSLASFLRPEQLKVDIIQPLHEAIKLSKQYLQAPVIRGRNEIMATILGLVADLVAGTRKTTPKGEYFDCVGQLKSQLQKKGVYAPGEDILYELSRLDPSEARLTSNWADTIAKVDDKEFWQLVGDLVRVVFMLHNLAQVSEELEIFTSAFKTITEEGGNEVPMECDINELVSVAVQTNARRAKSRKVSIKQHFHPQPLLVKVRKGEIFLALFMLLQNAVDAASQAKRDKRIEVTTKVLTGKGEVQVSISNNGLKIPKEDREKVGTEPFSHKENGTGFGLIFAYDWIRSEMNDGEIMLKPSIKSELTEFLVTIPLSKSP